jgi:hypothetical protein
MRASVRLLLALFLLASLSYLLIQYVRLDRTKLHPIHINPVQTSQTLTDVSTKVPFFFLSPKSRNLLLDLSSHSLYRKESNQTIYTRRRLPWHKIINRTGSSLQDHNLSVTFHKTRRSIKLLQSLVNEQSKLSEILNSFESTTDIALLETFETTTLDSLNGTLEGKHILAFFF